MFGVAECLLALGLLLLAALLPSTLQLGPSAFPVQPSGLFQSSTTPSDADEWLVAYSADDVPAAAKAAAASVQDAAAKPAPRAPVILAKDAVLKLPNAPVELRRLINQVAAEVKIAPALLHAVIATESGYNVDALSPRGAIGLMQLMPATAQRFGAPNPYDPRDNVLAGANYLKFLLKLFRNDMELVLAAYNAGHGAVMRAGNRIPEYPETMAYVPKVMAYMRCARSAACRPT
ncbi:MAG: lytic transglycosylase domain-containing protein [Burkholderiaceae bacterium]